MSLQIIHWCLCWSQNLLRWNTKNVFFYFWFPSIPSIGLLKRNSVDPLVKMQSYYICTPESVKRIGLGQQTLYHVSIGSMSSHMWCGSLLNTLVARFFPYTPHHYDIITTSELRGDQHTSTGWHGRQNSHMRRLSNQGISCQRPKAFSRRTMPTLFRSAPSNTSVFWFTGLEKNRVTEWTWQMYPLQSLLWISDQVLDRHVLFCRRIVIGMNERSRYYRFVEGKNDIFNQVRHCLEVP